MAKRSRGKGRKEAPPSSSYTDPEGNELILRQSLSAATRAKIEEAPGSRAATTEDAWRRRNEMLFERLAVRWVIAGLPLSDQKMLLGRYRIADRATQDWVDRTIAEHVRRHLSELQ